MKRLSLLLILIFTVSTFLTGCGVTSKLSSLKQSFSKAEKKTETGSTAPTVVIDTPGAVPVSGPTKTITLYFADTTGTKLVAEERDIAKVTGIARVTMEELIKGPLQAELKSTLPASTRLLDINVRQDGLAIVDFSGNLIKELPASADTEKLAVYSIVNTLTQFPTVEKVELRVDGKKVDTLLGHTKLSPALARNSSIIK